MIEKADIGFALRTLVFARRDGDLDTLARSADTAVQAIAMQPGLHPAMAATLGRLYGVDSVAKLETAMASATEQEPYGTGDALIVEYDLDEQARFEASCAREEAGWPDDA